MDEQAFWIKLRAIVKEEIAAAIQAYLNPPVPPEEENMVSAAELCRQLKISKPTLYNWLKQLHTKPLIEANRRKLGGRVSYNVNGIKAAIKKHPASFGGGRSDYEYKYESVLTAEQKEDRRYGSIKSKIHVGLPVSEADRNWYEAEKKRRPK